MSIEFATRTTLLAGLALTWLVQSTVLLALGLLAGRLVRKTGPAVQSAVYRTTLAAVLVCPIASVFLTAMGVDGLMLRLPSPRVEVPKEMALGVDFDFKIRPGTTSPMIGVASTSEASPQPVPASDMTIHETTQPAYSRMSMSVPIAGSALAVWMIGSIVLAVRLAVGQRRMTRLRASAMPVEPDVTALCHEVASRLNLIPPAVLRSPFLFSPCLDGLRRPAILLPDDVADDLRDTFVHELAHLVRHDGLWNLLRRSAVAILWVQPMLWILSRRLEVTAEEVCDDTVVQHGADRARYADHLVELAGRALPPTALTGVGMISLRSLLARRVVRILDSSRSLSTRAGRRAVAASICAGLAGTLLAGLIGVGGARQEAKAQTPPPKAAEAKPEVKTTDDGRTIRGQVVDPDGKPVPGATVYLTPSWGYLREPNTLVASTKAGPDGRFAIAIPGRSEYEHAQIVSAAAPGFGIGLIKTQPGDKLDDIRLGLVRDDVPVDGQIVDLEGKPIAGVSLRVIQVNASLQEDLGPWLAAVGRKEGKSYQLEHKYLSRYALEPSPTVKTDDKGRFRLTGIGRNRVAWLRLDGPTVVSQHLRVLTLPGKLSEVPHGGNDGESGEPLIRTTYFGGNFRHVAAPTRPIVGIVRDADTRKPLAGVSIRSHMLATRPDAIDDIVKTVTDAEGRFRLTGMPRGNGNKIVAIPEEDQPYVPSVKDVPDSPGLAQVTVEISLKRGVWIEGKVTDKATGKPVPETKVEYLSLYTNPNLAEYSGFVASIFFHLRPVKEDGSYRIAGLPGPGYVGVIHHDGYRTAPNRDDEFGTKESWLNTAPFAVSHPVNYAALAPIDPPKGADTVKRDITLLGATEGKPKPRVETPKAAEAKPVPDAGPADVPITGRIIDRRTSARL